MFGICNGLAQVDRIVNMTNDGLISSDKIADGLGQVVRLAVAEDLYDLFAIADRELNCEVIERLFVLKASQVC